MHPCHTLYTGFLVISTVELVMPFSFNISFSFVGESTAYPERACGTPQAKFPPDRIMFWYKEGWISKLHFWIDWMMTSARSEVPSTTFPSLYVSAGFGKPRL